LFSVLRQGWCFVIISHPKKLWVLDDYIFGIVGGLVMTTYLESPKIFRE
jgi:hypothetical protein